jgi:hypothetical protein
MTNLLFRMRVAVLWVAVAVAASYSIVLYLVGPGALEEMLGGSMEGDSLDSFALQGFVAGIILIPLAMVPVSLLVADRVNHYLNLVVGGLFGLFGAFAVAAHLMDGGLTGHVVLVAVAGILAFLIAGLGALGLRHPAAAPTAALEGSGRARTGAAA